MTQISYASREQKVWHYIALPARFHFSHIVWMNSVKRLVSNAPALIFTKVRSWAKKMFLALEIGNATESAQSQLSYKTFLVSKVNKTNFSFSAEIERHGKYSKGHLILNLRIKFGCLQISRKSKQILYRFLSDKARAEICQKVGWLFGRFEDTKISFWEKLTFSTL